jgi:hypothetical protein
MGGMLVAYTHCGVPGAGSGTKSTLRFGHTQAPNPGDSASASHGGSGSGNVSAFSTTIWPVTRNNCASCHGGIQQPLHASSNVDTAFSSAITNQKVDVGSPSRSRLYLKLKDERHNCWSDCDANAAEMLTAIEAYVSAINSAGGGDDTPQGLETRTLGPLTGLLNQGNQLLFSADQFMLQAPFVQKLDGSEYYFENQNNNGQLLRTNNNGAGRAYKNFSVPVSGDYNVWALVRAPSGSDDSFYFKIDDSQYYEWHIDNTSGFEWRKLTNTTARNDVKVPIVATGNNRLEVRQREDGTALKQVYLTEDDDFDPASGSFSSFAELSYDISSLVGQGLGSIVFKVNIRSFDEYTYEVGNLRIQSQVGVRIKAPKIMVNGRYSSQHNTYNYVEMTIQPGETTIADYSMLVLKENGDDSDLFSWQFDELELQ